MQGFIYIWRDKIRNMYYVGSHDGTLTDGYISSSRWFNAEYRYRPNDFRRKIIKFTLLSEMMKEEYRIIGLIKDHEYGTRFYNLKSGRKQGIVPWNKGRTNIYTQETLEKMSNAKRGKISPTKGKTNPFASNNGKKGALKQSKTASGRKMAIRPDGTRYWLYPESDCLDNKEQSANPRSITA